MDKTTVGNLCKPYIGQLKLDDNTLIDYFDIASVDNIEKQITGYTTYKFAEAPSRARKKVEKGNILVSTVRPNLNAVALFDEETENMPVASTGFCVLECKANTSPRFLFRYLQSQSFVRAMVSQATGASYPAVSDKIVRDTKLPAYSYEEQIQIANVLDATANIISKRKHQLQKLDDLVKARFVEMFGDPISNPKGWKKDKAESHIDLLSGYPFQSEQYVNDGINICGGLIIMPQKILWQDCRHWPSVDGYEDYLLAEDDIVMALDRPWISEGFKIAQVDSTHLPALLIQRTARIRGIDVNQQFLFHCFVNGGFDKHSNVTGSLVPHISAKDIRSFEILLPPIKLQKQFAAFVKQVDKSKVAIQKALDEAQLLFDSLMQKYFE